MNKLLERLQKTIVESDYMLATDYMTFYGIDETDAPEYADSFIEECYKYNEETHQHEERMPSELPFADIEYLDNGLTKYSYNGCSETK